MMILSHFIFLHAVGYLIKIRVAVGVAHILERILFLLYFNKLVPIRLFRPTVIDKIDAMDVRFAHEVITTVFEWPQDERNCSARE